jgi:hypothetical protein
MELAEYRRLSLDNGLELQDTHVRMASKSNNGLHHQIPGTALKWNQESNSSGNEASQNLLAGASKTNHIEQKNENIHFSSTKWRTNRPAWFMTVLLGIILVFLVLIINASILGWIYNNFRPAHNGTVVLFSGSCSRTSLITDFTHLLINILSTLLLAVSNNCAQLLTSPTRAEVDEAHKNGRWVHIGSFSYRNLRSISYWRIVGCCFLILSSLPLHLL